MCKPALECSGNGTAPRWPLEPQPPPPRALSLAVRSYTFCLLVFSLFPSLCEFGPNFQIFLCFKMPKVGGKLRQKRRQEWSPLSWRGSCPDIISLAELLSPHSWAISVSMWKSRLILSTPQFLDFLSTNVCESHLDHTLEIGPSGDFKGCWCHYLSAHVSRKKKRPDQLLYFVFSLSMPNSTPLPQPPTRLKKRPPGTHSLLTCQDSYSLQLRAVISWGPSVRRCICAKSSLILWPQGL